MDGYRLGDMLDAGSSKEMKRAWWHATNRREEKPDAPPSKDRPKKDNGSVPEYQSPISVYLASPYPTKPDMERIAEKLDPEGITVTSLWIWQSHKEMHELSEEEKIRIAQQNQEDMREADILVVFSPPLFQHSGTGGRHVELGLALEMGKPVLLVGDRVNIFHWHPSVRQIPLTSVEAMVRELKQIAQEYRSRSQMPDTDVSYPLDPIYTNQSLEEGEPA